MVLEQWFLPTNIIFGPDSLARLPEVAEGIGARRALVVSGAKSMERAGVLARVGEYLRGIDVIHHRGVPPNLPAGECDAIIGRVREDRPDVVIGIGGGSALDGAKAAALIGPNEGTVMDWIEGRVGPRDGRRGVPYIAVPTTSGTGSEVTPFMILLDTEEKRKLSLGAPLAFPHTAIVDPRLAVTMPPAVTAGTGLDALSHGLESFWSRNATRASDALALEAIETVLDSAERAYDSPGDIFARAEMSHASLLAGMALAQTATAAVHGLTYPLTVHHGVPHGMACAFLMREVLKINFFHLDYHKQASLLEALGARNIQAAIYRLTDLFESLGAPMTLADVGAGAGDIGRLAAEATRKNLEQNVASLGEDKILELWRSKLPERDI